MTNFRDETVLIRAALIAFTLMLFFGATGSMSGEYDLHNHHALVVGNASFEQARDLRNPINDADDVAGRLEDLGFEVHGGAAYTDLTRDVLLAIIRDFTAGLPEGATAVVFFAGHGLSHGGDTFLIPSDDAALRTRADLADHAVALRELTGRLAARTGVAGLVLVDACSANGLRGTGLGAGGAGDLVASPTGSLNLVYAAAPGQIAADGQGRNSPFTLALLTALQDPTRQVDDLFYDISAHVRRLTNGQQMPWMAQTLAQEQPPSLITR